MNRNTAKTIRSLIRGLIELVCLLAMILIPTWIVHEGHNMTWPGLAMIWIPLMILMLICMVIDAREVRREEREKEWEDQRQYEAEKQRHPERYR